MNPSSPTFPTGFPAKRVRSRVRKVVVTKNKRAIPAAAPDAPGQAPDPTAIANQLAELAPRGPTKPVSIKRSDAKLSNFELEDGSIIRIKPTIANVWHETGRFNDRGEPIYHFQIGFTVGVVAPPHLLQGLEKSNKRKSTRKHSVKKKR